MPNKNPYFIENKAPVVEIREIDYQVPSFEEFAKTYQENEQTNRFYEDIFQAEVLQGSQYGPGNSQSQLGANTGVFGVVGKETHSGRTMGNNQVVNYIRFHLNRQLTYANGRFSRIDFIDRSPFNNIQVGDTLKIDLDKVSNRNCNYKFSACDVAERGSVNLGNLTKKEEMAGKTAVGLFTAGANILCPELGELMTDVGRVGGFSAEIFGNLSGNKELEKLGEIVQTGAGVGSSANRVVNKVWGGREGHRESCIINCQEGNDLGEIASVASSVAEVAKFIVKKG